VRFLFGLVLILLRTLSLFVYLLFTHTRKNKDLPTYINYFFLVDEEKERESSSKDKTAKTRTSSGDMLDR
jgi:hypothetical protein